MEQAGKKAAGQGAISVSCPARDNTPGATVVALEMKADE